MVVCGAAGPVIAIAATILAGSIALDHARLLQEGTPKRPTSDPITAVRYCPRAWPADRRTMQCPATAADPQHSRLI